MAYQGPGEVKYLFIDGGCLRATLSNISARYFGGAALDINYTQLRGTHVKVFYYDAIPALKPGETDEDYADRTKQVRATHNLIATLDHYHVYEGDSRIRRKIVQQKKVDIMIAVDMLTHTFRGNMHKATLIASDLDFKPLIDALVREGMFVTLMYPPTETNSDLLISADQRVPLTIGSLYPSLDEKSQSLLKLPGRSLERAEQIAQKQISFSCEHPTFGIVQFYAEHGEYAVFWRDTANINLYMRVYSGQYDLLRKYVKDEFLIRLPEVSPTIHEPAKS